jgi:hypothetical protein
VSDPPYMIVYCIAIKIFFMLWESFHPRSVLLKSFTQKCNDGRAVYPDFLRQCGMAFSARMRGSKDGSDSKLHSSEVLH